MTLFNKNINYYFSKYFLKDLYWFFRKSLWRKLKKTIQYLPTIWQNEDWDGFYILDLLKYKLSRIERRFSNPIKYNVMEYVGMKNDIKYIRICQILIDCINAENYDLLDREKHENKWGSTSFIFNELDKKDSSGQKLYSLDLQYQKEYTKEEKNQEKEESIAISQNNEAMKQKHLDLLFNILRNRIELWWD